MSTSAVLLDYLILWRIFMLSPSPVFSSFFLLLPIYLCVEWLHFYVEKSSLIFLINFFAALKQVLQKELLKPDPGHLLPCGTHYSEMKAFICPILPFRKHIVYTVLDYLNLDYPTEVVSGIIRHIWLSGYDFGAWQRWGANRNYFNKSWH